MNNSVVITDKVFSIVKDLKDAGYIVSLEHIPGDNSHSSTLFHIAGRRTDDMHKAMFNVHPIKKSSVTFQHTSYGSSDDDDEIWITEDYFWGELSYSEATMPEVMAHLNAAFSQTA